MRPGICLHIGSIMDAVEKGMSEYDFMAGGEEYKYLFTKTDRELVTFAAGRSRAGLAGYLALEKASEFKARVSQMTKIVP
jgi:CelD/BcsL family acetyltransferase involved in cellulose biosynthesis